MKREDAVTGLNSKIPLPRDRYSIQCMEETFVQSKNTPTWMIVRNWEIVAPATIQVNGRSVEIAGTEVVQRQMTKIADGKGGYDSVKTKNALSRLFEEFETIGLPQDEIDENNPPLLLEGKVFDAILDNEEYTRCKEPTAEQLSKGAKQGDPILDENGKTIVGFKVKFVGLIGVSSVEPVAF